MSDSYPGIPLPGILEESLRFGVSYSPDISKRAEDIVKRCEVEVWNIENPRLRALTASRLLIFYGASYTSIAQRILEDEEILADDIAVRAFASEIYLTSLISGSRLMRGVLYKLARRLKLRGFREISKRVTVTGTLSILDVMCANTNLLSYFLSCYALPSHERDFRFVYRWSNYMTAQRVTYEEDDPHQKLLKERAAALLRGIIPIAVGNLYYTKHSRRFSESWRLLLEEFAILREATHTMISLVRRINDSIFVVEVLLTLAEALASSGRVVPLISSLREVARFLKGGDVPALVTIAFDMYLEGYRQERRYLKWTFLEKVGELS